MNIKQLRRLVLETIQEEKQYKAKSHRRQLSEGLRRAKMILEGTEGTSGLSPETNTGGQEAIDLINAMYDDFPKFQEMMKALGGGWALEKNVKDENGENKKGEDGKNITEPMEDSEIQEAIKSAFGTKEETLKRMEELNKKLADGQGYAKAYMPALEGADAKFLQDALNAQGGELGVDTSPKWKDDESDFKSWYQEHESEIGEDGMVGSGEQEAQNSSYYRQGLVMSEVRRWNKLAGLLTEANEEDGSDEEGGDGSWTGGGPTPFEGPTKPMPGAPKVDEKSKIDPGAIGGEALAFLKKGKGTGDKMEVEINGTMPSSALKPTQKEVKLGKTMAFALKNIGQDFEGAYADNEGNILDGHHRWSGQFLRKGDVTHKGLNIIKRNKAYAGDSNTKAFLRMLTSIGNALGRGTKTK